MKHLFNRNMGNFKFSFLSRGQLGSKSIDNAFLNVFKMLTGKSTSLVTLFLHLLLGRSAEIVSIIMFSQYNLQCNTVLYKMNTSYYFKLH